jgi:putative membrane protein
VHESSAVEVIDFAALLDVNGFTKPEEMRMRSIGLMAIGCAAALTVACAGDTRDDTTPADTGQLETADDRADADRQVGTTGETGGAVGVRGDARDFIEKAAHGGMAEVQLGQLASERGENPEVKRFGQMMVRDHTKAGEELKQTVAAHNITVPAELDEEHRDLIEKLRNLRGAEFDREYIAAMVDGHQEMQSLLEDRADDARDPEPRGAPTGTDAAVDATLNQWALETKPSVDQHLQTAQQIQEKLRGNRNTTN